MLKYSHKSSWFFDNVAATVLLFTLRPVGTGPKLTDAFFLALDDSQPENGLR